MSVETKARSTQRRALWPSAPPEFSELARPERLLVPLSVRGVAEPRPKAPGTKLRRGESVVESPAESSHVPLAPAAGTLGEIRPIRLTTGRPATAVELFPSGDDEAASQTPSKPGDDSFPLLAGLERLRAAGVWADRRASPDLIGQLNQILTRPIDTLICTVLDTDASLRLCAAVAATWPQRVTAGAAMLAEMTGARRAVIAAESSANVAWLRSLYDEARRAEIQIVNLPNDYPQSDPVLMVYTLTHRRARPGNLPTTHGALVLDAAAALAAGDAARGEPMLTVPVAVHEHASRRSHFFLVPIGTSVEAILKHLWIEPDDVILRGGDLLRDLRLRHDAVIAGGELAIHITACERPSVPEPCIRCAWCIEACPTRVHPALVLDAAQRADSHMAQRAGIAACIECGVCEHVCPSRLPLLKAIREMRAI